MSKILLFFISTAGLMTVITAYAICKIASESARIEEKMQFKITEYCDNDCFKCSEWHWCKFSDRKLGGK